MFSQSAMAQLLENNRALFEDLLAIESILNARFYGMEHQIHCMMLAVASGESMLLIGPPGTAKSRLVRAFAQLADLLGEDEFVGAAEGPEGGVSSLKEYHQEPHYFEYLLTPFTEPGELFGFFDVGKLFNEHTKSGQLERLHEGMMQHARVVFLDEVFNASSAILNSLLTFINERKFHDRGRSYEVKMSCLFGATNFPPKRPELVAIYDRFLLRSWVENTHGETDRIGSLLQTGWQETNAADLATRFPYLMDRVDHFRADIRRASADKSLEIDLGAQDVRDMMVRLTDFVQLARSKRLSQLSNRRLIRFSKIFLVNALLRAAKTGSHTPQIEIKTELDLLARFGMDRMPMADVSDEFASLLVPRQS